jgi:RNA polymerase sigma-70 factor (ECF subfamily)
MIGGAGPKWEPEAREQRVSANEFDDPAFLQRLRAGDARAYDRLVRRYHGTLVGVATSVIGSRAQAEEVVQDTWLAVLGAIERFEGRSSLVTWLFSIVMNRARTRIAREGRTVGLPAGMDGSQGEERAVPLSAFQPDGHWTQAPRLWDELDPERVIAGRQLWEHVLAGVETLPAGQKAVLVLRDMEGVSAEEACELLQISPENQRVLLHRARGRIRALIDQVTAPPREPAQGGPARGPVASAGASMALLLSGLAQAVAHYAEAMLFRPWRSHAIRAWPSAR